MRRTALYWLLVFVIGVIIFSLSSVPGLMIVNSSWVPAEWKQWIDLHTIKIGTKGWFAYMIAPDPDFILRKIGHFVLFGLLGLAVFQATGSVGWAMLLSVSFAISDEVHQHFIGGRHGNIYDMMIDSMGAACFIWWRARYLNKSSREKGKTFD